MGQIRFILLLPLLWFSSISSGQTLDDSCLPPARQNVLVYDFADLLSSGEERALQANLSAVKDTTSNVIVVVTHPDFCGYESSVFAIEAGDKWGVGRGDKDNGVVIAIKPRSGSESGKLFIAVGSGLEGAIPDILTGRIVDRMIPHFKSGDWLGGLQLGVNDIAVLASGEISVDDYMQHTENAPPFAAVVFLILIFGLIPLLAIFLNTRREMTRNNLNFWMALALVLNDMQRKRRTYNSFRGGYRGSSGGFGGFGGGGFSGGGAGGSF